MAQPRVGLQLIIYGPRARQDLAGVLREVAEAGYDGFEGGAPAGPDEVDRVRAALDGTGLAFAGGHSGMAQLEDGALVSRMAGSVKALGGDFLMVSGRFDSLEGYRAGAATLNQAGRRCRDAGVTLCYHNHSWEFEPSDGARPIDVLIGETDPQLVKLCPDVYWVHVGGDDPAAFVRQHRDRCPYFHFKDGQGGERYQEFLELGRGCVDLPAALQAALACQPAWVVVEQDSTRGEPADSIAASRRYLRSLGL